MFYDIDGQINNLYNMHSRQSSLKGKAAVDMSDADLDLIRDRIGLLREKLEST